MRPSFPLTGNCRISDSSYPQTQPMWELPQKLDNNKIYSKVDDRQKDGTPHFMKNSK
ncbi:hypothetical protein LEP1GSC133_0707 [Leptospira borgpetersenii serovar Pomona str. 200901868]|uniref:Uncharacterized protein n=1 Tax=Leptospira borgpetersenii serovar Pomona str. 200901868 TaxID=1192866 RepID=M6VWH5_LEPBO|nr:hypothetical protein LEP1GSC133_0707 [Leptospira borgpetersenii serovar Pomona str. 200901868]